MLFRDSFGDYYEAIAFGVTAADGEAGIYITLPSGAMRELARFTGDDAETKARNILESAMRKTKTQFIAIDDRGEIKDQIDAIVPVVRGKKKR